MTREGKAAWLSALGVVAVFVLACVLVFGAPQALLNRILPAVVGILSVFAGVALLVRFIVGR